MIHVDRSEPAPEILGGEQAFELLTKADEHFAADDARSEQFEFDWGEKPPFKHVTVRKALMRVFASRCAFCETEVGAGSRGIIHHLRPTQEAVGLEGRPSRPHYWWLAFVWDNLYLSCARCASGVRRRFPVQGERISYGEDVVRERALVVDPCRDEPDHHIAFHDSGEAAALSEAGTHTIEIFRLNRPELIDARRQEIARALAAVSARLAEGKPIDESFLGVDRPYTGAVRQNVRRVLEERGVAVGEIMLAAEAAITRRTVERAIGRQRGVPVEVGQVERIEIRDFRGIRDLDIDFSVAGDPDPEVDQDEDEPDQGARNWTMLLGENGQGKSSVLQALALALVGSTARAGLNLRDEDLIRQGALQAEITVTLKGVKEPRRLTIERKGITVTGHDRPIAVAAYGASRIPARNLQAGPTPEPEEPRVHNLFAPGAALIAAVPWLLATDSETFRSIASSLRELVAEPEAAFVRRDGTIQLERPEGPPVPFEQLSDGYRALIALAVDVMAYFSKRFGSLGQARGVVLVDEISVHLHPRWQMRVVVALSKAFPDLQFIATTHDPLSLRGMDDGRIVVLKRATSGDIFRLPADEVPSVAGLRVDELLTSPVFGLNTTVDPETADLFDAYYRELALPEAERDDAHIRQLHAHLAEHGQMGRSRREDLVLRAADEHLATEDRFTDPITRRDRIEATKQRLRALWQGED